MIRLFNGEAEDKRLTPWISPLIEPDIGRLHLPAKSCKVADEATRALVIAGSYVLQFAFMAVEPMPVREVDVEVIRGAG